MDAQQQPSESRDIPSVSGKVSGKDMQHPFGKVAKKLKAMLAEFVSRDEITEEAIDSLAQFIRHERDAGETILDDAAQKESQLKLLRDELKELRDEERLNSSYAKQLAYENQSLRKQKKQNNPESDLDFEKWEKASSSLMRFKYLVPKITAGSEDELRWLTRYVEFCGHGKQAFALDSHNLVDTYCDQVWEALHVLHDYAALKNSAKPYQGDLLRYLRERDHSGFAINSSRLSSESESLKNNKKLAKQRLLPVPKHIDSAGRLYMWDHFKFGNTPPAPRLYFYDATGEDGKIYIGYIGEHLENSLTN
jgi:adenylate kinase family enzyme